ncbi:bifunctional diaminohydroxyphosphoribosylaminopyrimidine deaminase/5-amino-6-(5-phosphoribosylamino)uracil reductase RibD [bacterium]|nr:bifunctional diaminohydroxyphosphoribosylaminopyrimidine deaminase/5-amino-6-(5-phosphoribosylamino)uracil reductase RibD [bacterium]
MRRALSLARRGWGRTSPNPLVGAVVVRDGAVVGEGFHRCAGTPHAEVHALAAAGQAARGATLYVTLEPCSTTGRTPPCTEAILAAGVARVVVGCLDPNPRHVGRGVEILRERGLGVDVGVLEPACREVNEAFFCWVTHRRPFVLLKMAMTLDGRIATASGDSKWVTGEAARRHVQKLRRWGDAIMVGAETVRQDDPELTVRMPKSWPAQPRKLVWTQQASLPRDLKIWADPAGPPEFVCATTAADWQALLLRLGAEDVTALLIEGGGELAAAVLAAGIVDKVAFFIGPKILGGRGSRPVVGGGDPARLSQALGLRELRARHVGEDLLVTGCPDQPGMASG